MQRSDFIFTVGYEGMVALIDNHAKRRYAKYGTLELAEAGLLRAAFCSALYSGDEKEQQQLLDWYREHSGVPATNFEQLKSYYGVFEIPSNNIKTHGI